MYSRRAKTDDIPFIMDAERHPDNAPYVLQWEYNKHFQSLGNPDFLYLIFYEKSTDNEIGFCILTDVKNNEGKILLKRIVITSKGNGFGKKAMSLILEIVFEKLKATKLSLEVFPENQRAIGFYQATGWTEESFTTDRVIKDGKFVPCYIFSIQSPAVG